MTPFLTLQSQQWNNALKLLSDIDTHPESKVAAFLRTKSLGQHGLDIGCGLGRHTLLALKLGYEMTAIDFSRYAIEKTQKLIYSHGYHAKIYIASMHKLPFRNNEFDFTFSWCVLNHGTKYIFTQSLIESMRVLRPGGLSLGLVISRKDPRFRQGISVEKNCFLFTEGVEEGILHFFPSKVYLQSVIMKYAHIRELLEIQHHNTSHYHPRSIFSSHLLYLIQKVTS